MTTREEREERRTRLRPLFDFMRDRGITKTWLARRLNISLPRLLSYETGAVRTPEWLAPKACRELGIPMSWIGGPTVSGQRRRKTA